MRSSAGSGPDQLIKGEDEDETGAKTRSQLASGACPCEGCTSGVHVGGASAGGSDLFSGSRRPGVTGDTRSDGDVLSVIATKLI